MSTFKLYKDANNRIDLAREKGAFIRIEGKNEFAQRGLLRFGTGKGEWFLNPDYGFPIFQEILGRSMVNREVINSMVVREALSIPDWLAFEDSIQYTFDKPTSKLYISFRMLTTDGVINVDVL